MAETLVKNRICNSCGTEVRANALFCYHCGGSVAPEIVSGLTGRNADEKNGDGAVKIKETLIKDSADKPIPKPRLPEETNLKSAATMRRKSKSFQPKRTEVIWEEHENAPNGWFILMAILITLFAAGALFLALRLR